MRIGTNMRKELKDYEFIWQDDNKTLVIAKKDAVEDFIMIDKIRMLSLMRFIIRVLAHLSTKHRVSI